MGSNPISRSVKLEYRVLYYGHVRGFLEWEDAVGLPKEAYLITTRHILSFFNHLLQEAEILVGSNGSRRKVNLTKDSLWPYYQSLRRFFGWHVLSEDEKILCRLAAPYHGLPNNQLECRIYEPPANTVLLIT